RLRSGRRADHRIEQALDRGGRVGAAARVDRRGLDDRAARRHEPMETLSLGEPADRAGSLAPAADHGDRLEVASYEVEVDVGREGGDPARIELDACIEEVEARAGQDHAGV